MSTDVIDVFSSLKYNNTSIMGRVARHQFPSGWGVSVLRLSNNRWTEGYTHGYEVMLTHNDRLCMDDDTPITHGDSLRLTDAGEVVEFLEKVMSLEPKSTADDAQHEQQ